MTENTICGGSTSFDGRHVDVMCDLFHMLVLAVAVYFGFTYRQEEEAGMREYLGKTLPYGFKKRDRDDDR